MSGRPLYAGIIRRLRERAPVFERRVGGTAAFQVAADAEKEGADVAVPQAWVVPLHMTAAPPSQMGEPQRVTERFAVIVCLSNASARESGLGLIAADMLGAMQQELLNALMPRRSEWAPEVDRTWLGNGLDGCRLIGGRHLMQNRVRMWHQFEFEVAYYVNYEEVEDACIPLREAYLRLHVEGTPRPPGYDDFDLVYASNSPLLKDTAGASDEAEGAKS